MNFNPVRGLRFPKFIFAFFGLIIFILIFSIGFAKADDSPKRHPISITKRNHSAVCTNVSAKGRARCIARVVVDNVGNPEVGFGPSGYGPLQFHTAYNLPNNASSGNPIIAIVDAYDAPNAYSDLTHYSSYFGIPQLPQCVGSVSSSSVPCFAKIDQNGGRNYPFPNASWALEISLDIQVAHAICQNCKILLVEANSNSLNDLLIGINQAVSQGATAISNSWAANEFLGESSFDSYLNHPGIVITAASGDSGYSAGTVYPASSPYVISVGGTTLQINSDNTYFGESVWNGTGSGCSIYESKPSWQKDNGCLNRTLNDISADADPSTGAAIYDTSGYGGWVQVGGTSLATPLIASAFALAGIPTSVQEGSVLYANSLNFHDIVSGNNGLCGSYLCNAQLKFDGPTGLGTPNSLGGFGGASILPSPTLSPTPISTPTVTLTPTPTNTPTPTLTPTPTPQPVSVVITNPQNNSTVSRNSTVLITTNTSSNVAQVNFTVNGNLICSVKSAPFNCSWSISNRRTTYTIRATAFNSLGNTSQNSIRVTSR